MANADNFQGKSEWPGRLPNETRVFDLSPMGLAETL